MVCAVTLKYLANTYTLSQDEFSFAQVQSADEHSMKVDIFQQEDHSIYLHHSAFL